MTLKRKARRATPLRWLSLISILGCFACAALLSGPGGDAIKFPHGAHRKAQVECLTCHEAIYDAKSLEGGFLPKEKKCLECHEEKKQKGQCGFCHTDARRPATYRRPEPDLKMGHAGHIELVKEDCARCHTALPEPGRKSGQTTAAPTMAACLSCHEHQAQYDAGRCEVCHKDLTRYPIKPVSLFSHQGNYVKEHGRSARAAARTCAQCHEQTFCADCHASTVSTLIEVKLPERQDRDFIHRGDFVSRHSVEAQADPASCMRCHGISYCEGCHAKQNLTKLGDNPRDPHPPGWSVPGTPQFHGQAARRDIVSCAACHDQGPQTNCIECHKVGGPGGNPHPMGWLGHHGAQEIHRSSMCLYCHS